MINPEAIISYAQYHEDMTLAALLHDVKKGFYVDVGANHEEYHSVTKYFYKLGWHGINIEPIPRLIDDFKKKRPRDINLQMAVSTKPGELELRDYPEHDGLSTLSKDTMAALEGQKLPFHDYRVKVDSLKNIFSQQQVQNIDFLKVDVEGYEFEVIQSNDWEKYRPTVICIEANHRNSDWSTYISDQKYVRVIADGLNEYYIAQESITLFDGFADRAALLAHNSLRNHQAELWLYDIKRIKFLEDVTEKQDALIKSTQGALRSHAHEEARLREASFEGKPLLHRLQIALKGLTVDYYRDRRSTRG